MQKKKMSDLSHELSRSLLAYFKPQKKVDSVTVEVVSEEPRYSAFNIYFTYCEYYKVCFSYEKSFIGFSLRIGENLYMGLHSSQTCWSDNLNFDKLFREFEEEIELRIPDKYLIAKGWRKQVPDDTELVNALIFNYLKAEYAMNDAKSQTSLEYLSQEPDILEEFKKYIVKGDFEPDDYCIKVEGYSAKDLNVSTYLTPLGSFNYLVYLRRNPQKALADLKAGLPRK